MTGRVACVPDHMPAWLEGFGAQAATGVLALVTSEDMQAALRVTLGRGGLRYPQNNCITLDRMFFLHLSW